MPILSLLSKGLTLKEVALQLEMREDAASQRLRRFRYRNGLKTNYQMMYQFGVLMEQQRSKGEIPANRDSRSVR